MRQLLGFRGERLPRGVLITVVTVAALALVPARATAGIVVALGCCALPGPTCVGSVSEAQCLGERGAFFGGQPCNAETGLCAGETLPTPTPTSQPVHILAHIFTNRGCRETGDAAVFTVGDPIVVSLVAQSNDVADIEATIYDHLADGTINRIFQDVIPTNQTVELTSFAVSPPTGVETLQLNAATGTVSANAECSFTVVPATVESTATPTLALPPSATETPTPTKSGTPSIIPTPAPTQVRVPCIGDCDGSGSVTVNELITLVNIGLDNAAPSACPKGIPAGTVVNIAFVIHAVDDAIDGCPAALAAACYDQQQDDQETDIDCGGALCHSCSLGSSCIVGDDCASGSCADGFCAPPPTCYDGIRDGDETDVDCGGPYCSICLPGGACNGGSDCDSHVCTDNACQMPRCSDSVLNGDETDVDCGGASCGPCPLAGACDVDTDCESHTCDDEHRCTVAAPTPTATPPNPPPTPTPTCDCDTCDELQMNGGTLPNPTKCKKAGDPDCNGWTPDGTLDNMNDISGAGLNRAALFIRRFITECGEFLCIYLPRFNVPTPPDNMLHGLLCFNEMSCDACAYDLNMDPDDPTKDRPFTNLGRQKQGAGSPPNTVNCSGCHAPGPILPKYDLWKDAQDELGPINDACSQEGGPNWLCFGDPATLPSDPTDQWAKRKPGNVVKNDTIKVPTTGGGTRDFAGKCFECHAAFVPKPNPPDNDRYCSIIKASFLPGGSMHVGVRPVQVGQPPNPKKFPSVDDCIAFMKAMGCDPPDSTEFCKEATGAK